LYISISEPYMKDNLQEDGCRNLTENPSRQKYGKNKTSKKTARQEKSIMRTKLFTLLVFFSLLSGACAQTTPEAVAPAPQTIVETVVVEVEKLVEVEKKVEVEKIVEVEKLVTPEPAKNPESIIEGVEEGAEITLWTFWLSPTFDQYVLDTIARFNAAYPGVTVKWEDHQATFLDDLRNAYAAKRAPDVINLSNGEGWVSEFASKGLLLPLDSNVDESVKNMYFPGLWKVSLIDGVNYQFPWYAAVATELINTKIYVEQAGLSLDTFPTKVQELPEVCATIVEKTGILCDIRLTVNDLPAQMIYEGGVEFISADGTKFLFDSPQAVAWLQMYVDMVNADLLDLTALMTDNDRVALDLFISGQAPFFQTGPQLIREVRSSNPGLYGYLAVKPAPVGLSEALPPTAMGISVNAQTAYPQASLALAQFFTNPTSMLEFSKIVAIYPSTPDSYSDAFFSSPSVAIEDSVKPIARDILAMQTDRKPTIPHFKDVNEILLQAVQQALFNNVPAQKALSDAVVQANALLK
jgi:putative chitobiose transport system substrate-binding protein